MKIPEKVRIGNIDYAVRYEERLNNGSNLAYGHINYDKALIRIDADLKDEQGKFQTLLHEILHGLAKFFELSVEEDEDTIEKLAKGLHMLIKDNPEMFKDDE
jgi:Zn-dependent peptidase ImmA (M78 family)